MTRTITSDNKSGCVKILHVVPDMGYGGVEKVVLNYYEQFDHDEYHFDYVTHGPVMEHHSKLIDQGSRLYYFKSIGQLGMKKYTEQINENISVEEYDVVHIHVGHLTGVYAKAFKGAKAQKVICHAHTTMCVNRMHKLLMPLFRFLSVRYSDALVGCGEDASKYCFGRANYSILPNGLDFNKYREIKQDHIAKLKSELGIKDGALVVGHVGRFSKEKNHTFLVDVIHDYVKTNKNVKFIFVGNGPDKETIEKSIQANGDEQYVIFTGVRDDIANLMKVFDVFVLPSLFEGIPVVGIEAQAAGTPCVFSDTIDKTVCICDDRAVFLPINKGTEAWIKAIDEMRACGKNSDACIYDALCKNGYEISVATLKLKEIYNSLISDN